jgi:alkyl hydroperoxide reductase subunit AhpC
MQQTGTNFKHRVWAADSLQHLTISLIPWLIIRDYMAECQELLEVMKSAKGLCKNSPTKSYLKSR